MGYTHFYQTPIIVFFYYSFQGAIQCLTIGLAPKVGCNTTYLKKYSKSLRLCSTNAGVNLPTTFFGGSLGILLFIVGYCLMSSSRNSTKSEYLLRTVIGAPYIDGLVYIFIYLLPLPLSLSLSLPLSLSIE